MADEPKQDATVMEPREAMIVTEDVNARIKPALDVLKDLLARSEKKRKEEAEAKAVKESIQYAAQNAEPVKDTEGQYYITMDGDGIGNRVAQAQFTNDELKVREVSEKIKCGNDAFIQWTQRMGGSVIEEGGDEAQSRVPASALEHIEEFRKEYQGIVGATVTMGVGKTISESIQARELGKLRGKNVVVYFDDTTEKELKILVEQAGEKTEADKIRESHVLEKKESTPKYALEPGEFEMNKKKEGEYFHWKASILKPEGK